MDYLDIISGIASIIGIISGIASIIGCLISIHQARKAKKYADQIHDISNRIDSKAEIEELNKIDSLLKKAKNSIYPFAQASNIDSISGLDFSKTKKCIHEYLFIIKSNTLLFKFDNGNNSEDHCNTIENLLLEIDSDESSIFIISKQIYKELTNFSKYIKKWIHDNESIICGIKKQ